jgi:hypothetical protein
MKADGNYDIWSTIMEQFSSRKACGRQPIAKKIRASDGIGIRLGTSFRTISQASGMMA